LAGCKTASGLNCKFWQFHNIWVMK
jgi:hypothetical protein